MINEPDENQPTADRRGLWSAAAFLVVAACLALAGCGGAKKSHRTSTSSATTSRSTSTAAPPKPIVTTTATTVGEHGPEPFQVFIYDLRRDGPFLVLDFGTRCLAPQGNGGNGCSDSAFAPNSNAANIHALEGDLYTPAGVNLVDPVNLKEYLAVRDSEQRPFSTYVEEGGKDSLIHLQWVRYAAPPASVTSLDLAFPNGGPLISHVPITSGSAPIAAGDVRAEPAGGFAQAPTSTSTTGLTLPVFDLSVTTGNSAASDTESPTRSSIALRGDVLFRFNQSSLTSGARALLRSVAAKIKARAKGPVQVTGYTDSIGSPAFNLGLSQRRAQAVVAALSALTPGVHYSSAGKGEADPVAPNQKPDGSDNPAGRALNRRVTVAYAVAGPPKPPSPPQASASTTAGPSTTIRFSPPASGGNATYGTSVLSAYRDGGLLAVDLSISCVRAKVAHACAPTLDLGGTPIAPPQTLFSGGIATSDPQAQNTISGFYLLDPTNGTEYVPVHAGPAPVTGYFHGGPIPVGVSYRMWELFSAPPPSTTSLTLAAPGGHPRLTGIPIAGSPPPNPS